MAGRRYITQATGHTMARQHTRDLDGRVCLRILIGRASLQQCYPTVGTSCAPTSWCDRFWLPLAYTIRTNCTCDAHALEGATCQASRGAVLYQRKHEFLQYKQARLSTMLAQSTVRRQTGTRVSDCSKPRDGIRRPEIASGFRWTPV